MLTPSSIQHLSLDDDTRSDLSVPKTCPVVPSEILNPERAWSSDTSDFGEEVKRLGQLLVDNFKNYEDENCRGRSR